jgi:hypothetical protein
LATRCFLGLLAALTLAVAPAAAEEVRFHATLRGDAAPTATGSRAVGKAVIVVDTERQTVDMTLDVTGIKTADLWTRLVAAPPGPIHLHMYGAHDHSHTSDAELVLPTPYGSTYADTAEGFQVRVKGFAYADARKILKSPTTFDQFLGSMRSGAVRLNIHTNAQNAGEISGEVRPAQS